MSGKIIDLEQPSVRQVLTDLTDLVQEGEVASVLVCVFFKDRSSRVAFSQTRHERLCYMSTLINQKVHKILEENEA